MPEPDQLDAPPIPESFHEDTDTAMAYFDEAGLEHLANYLGILKADYEAGQVADSDRYLRIEDVPEAGVDIGGLLDLAVYFGMVWERENSRPPEPDDE